MTGPTPPPGPARLRSGIVAAPPTVSRAFSSSTTEPTDGAPADAERDADALDTIETDPGGKAAPGLHIVGVPIGNRRDITLRAIDTLRSVDLIACEDTRVTRKLLGFYGIDRPTMAYHEHNAAEMRPRLLNRLADGAAIALTSDAGLPTISDPGLKLTRAARRAGHTVTVVPGPSAVLTGLVSSGLPTDRFLFAGFPPAKAAARRTALAELMAVPATLILFESAKRLPAALADIAALDPARAVAVTRELTKRHEEVRDGTAEELADHYAAAGPPKGEVTLVIGPPAATAEPADDDTVDAALRAALATMSVRDAAATVAAATSRPRRQVYQRALALAAETDDGS